MAHSESIHADVVPLQLATASKAVARLKYLDETQPKPAISVLQALATMQQMLDQGRNIHSVELHGPGDPLADISETVAVIVALKTKFPEISIGIRTIGIGCSDTILQLLEVGLDFIDIEIQAVDPLEIQKLYAWIRPGKKTLSIAESSHILCDEQMHAIRACLEKHIPVRVVSKIISDENVAHLVEVANRIQTAGISEMILEPVDTEVAAKKCTISHLIESCKKNCEQYLTVSLASSWICPEQTGQSSTGLTAGRSAAQPNVAVASDDGFDINLHLGQAKKFLIYGPRPDGLVCLLETRSAPEAGIGTDRWLALAKTLEDCFLVLASGAGENPRKVMADQGVPIYVTEENIEGFVDVLYGGGKKGKKAFTAV